MSTPLSIALLLSAVSVLAGELPEGWQTRPPREGTYAATYRYHNFSSCSQSWSNFNVDAALTLTLRPGGEAEMCRERRAEDTYPDGHSIFADLQSMSGRYTRRGDWIEVELVAGGARCGEPRTTYATPLQPWKLRCSEVTPPPGTPLSGTGAPLLCRFIEPVYSESSGLLASGLVPSSTTEWLVLGAAPGLAVQMRYGADWVAAPEEEGVQVARLSALPKIGGRVEGLIFPPPR